MATTFTALTPLGPGRLVLDLDGDTRLLLGQVLSNPLNTDAQLWCELRPCGGEDHLHVAVHIPHIGTVDLGPHRYRLTPVGRVAS